jgi:hypothetical protein
MNYAVEMGLDAMIYIPKFIKTASCIQKLMGWGDSQTDRQRANYPISLLFFFKIGKAGSKYYNRTNTTFARDVNYTFN